MAKRRPTEKTPRSPSAPSKLSRQERRRAARNDAKAQRTVATMPSGGFGRQDALALVALGLLVVVCYLPAMLWGGFVWDDDLCIEVDPVRNVSGLWQIWFAPSAIEEEGHYWPLVYTTFWLEHKLWGFDPTGYHIVNVLLHLANTLLLWHLLRRLAVPGAWVVAAVFAVHPLHVESVAWVIERKDVLSGLFYLSAVLTYMRFVERPSRGWYAGSLTLYAAGMLSKSIVVTLPVALLIWHWWKQGRVTATDLLRVVPFFAVGLVITVGDLSFYRSSAVLPLDYSLMERTLIAARALWFYAGKLLWPSNLSVIYPLWDIRVADPLAWGYLIAALALAVSLWHFRPQLGRGPLAGALFFAVTLSPVLGFVEYTYMQYAFVADRFQYLAGIGIIAVVIGSMASGVCRLSDLWQKVVLGVAIVAVVVLGLLTWRQASIYRDNETFNRHIIALNPQAWVAYLHLGNALYDQGRYAEALTAYRIAAEQNPNYVLIHSNLGLVLNELGRFKEAEKHLRRAIALNPQDWHALLSLVKVLCDQGRYAETLEATRIVIELRPDDAVANSILGLVLNKLGRFKEAEKHLRRAIALNPQARDAHLNIGVALYNQDQYEAAITAYRVAIAQDPDNALAHANLGAALNELRRFEEAEAYLRRAIVLDPSHTEALYFLATLRFEQQHYDETLKLLQRLIALEPNDAAAHVSMGVALYYLGRSDEALQRFDQALSLDPTLENARTNREALLEEMEGN